MAKENLVKRLGKKVLPYVLSGFLALGGLGGLSAHYGCSDNGFVKPEPKKPDDPVTMLAPVAMLTANPTEGDAPLEVSFDGSLSYAREPGTHIKTYEWDVDGDGYIDKISGQPQINHTYENAGTYNASLVVEDSQGQISDKALEKIVVNEEEIIPLGTIAFWSHEFWVYGGDSYNEDIYLGDIIDGNLENITRLTTHPSQDLAPAWSPDGEYLSWATNRDGLNSIYVMNADGTNKRKLTPAINTDFLFPWWSPDGTQIAFAFIDRDLGTNGITKINSDGSGSIIKIVENPGIGTLPGGIYWNSDGKIFYHDSVDGNGEIYSMNPDGSDKTRITNTPYDEIISGISPEDNRLIYVTNEFGGEFNGLEIMSMAIDGTDVRRITNTYEMEAHPKYSNDGTKILFSRWLGGYFPDGYWQMFLVNPNGTNEIQIESGVGGYSVFRPDLN